MKKLVYSIQDKVGLHARPSSKLIRSLSAYKSKVSVQCNGKVANAKSLMNLMSLQATFGTEIEFLIEGEDEDDLAAALPGILEELKI